MIINEGKIKLEQATMNGLNRTAKILDKHKFIILTLAIASITLFSFAFAAVDAESKWQQVMGLLIPWIQRLGGVVMLVGGVMFGLGFKSDDADQKTRGLSTLVAGAIVIAVVSMSAIFIW